jgi:hypothetical protein
MPSPQLDIERRFNYWIQKRVPNFQGLRTGFDSGESLIALLQALWPAEKPPQIPSDARGTRIAALEWAQKIGVGARFDDQILTAEANSDGPNADLLFFLREVYLLRKFDPPSDWTGGAYSFCEEESEPEDSVLPSSAKGKTLKRSRSAGDVHRLLYRLTRKLAWEEKEECARIRSRANALGEAKRHQECCDRLKLSIWGTGESEYSAACKWFIEGRLEAFCSLEKIDDRAIMKFQRTFQLVSEWPIWYQSAPIAYHLSCLAAAEPDTAKAVRLHKEAIFWYAVECVDEPFGSEQRSVIYGEIYELRQRQRA